MSLDLRQLEGFNAKDFERVVQSWANSTNVLPPELHQAYLHRLAENRVSLSCLHTVIFDAYELGWRPVQLATAKYLQSRHDVAVKVLALYSQNKANSTPRYESSRTGPEDNLTFTTEVVLDIGGTSYHGWATGTQSKAVKQAAVARLLAAVVGFRNEDLQLLNIEVACPDCGAVPMHPCIEDGEDMGFRVHNGRRAPRNNE